mmetsp:Transcript_26498/g.34839  ORF Transcript_26498/g.34839 Transcript_26498/m.34839 type:complete len:403 (-) Transcript_26498:85-1293(-)
MFNYEIAEQNDFDVFPSINPNAEEVENNLHHRILKITAVRNKCVELFQSPVNLLCLIATVQMLWTFGLTIHVNSKLHSTRKPDVTLANQLDDFNTNIINHLLQTVEELQESSLSANKTIKSLQTSLNSATSKIDELEGAFAVANKTINELQSRVAKKYYLEGAFAVGEETESSQDQDEIIVGSGSTKNIRLIGRKIWFEDSKEIQIHEIPTPTSREWSENFVEITVGTKITWTWTSNENLVEASENFAVKNDPAFSSGAIQHGGAVSYIFETPGTYYFVSENTASMRGTVVVSGTYMESGSLSVTDITVTGTYYGANIPNTIHSLCTRDSSSSNEGGWAVVEPEAETEQQTAVVEPEVESSFEGEDTEAIYSSSNECCPDETKAMYWSQTISNNYLYICLYK